MTPAQRAPMEFDNAYRYISEAYGGYHFNALHGINVDAASSCRISGCSATTNSTTGLSAVVCFIQHAVFFNGVRIQIFRRST